MEKLLFNLRVLIDIIILKLKGKQPELMELLCLGKRPPKGFKEKNIL